MAKKTRLSAMDLESLVTDEIKIQPEKEEGRGEVPRVQERPKEKIDPKLLGNENKKAFEIDLSYHSQGEKSIKSLKTMHDLMQMFVVENSMKGINTTLKNVINRALFEFLVRHGKISKCKTTILTKTKVQIETSPGVLKTTDLDSYSKEELLELIYSAKEKEQNIYIINKELC